jgi:hypothetical protein
VTGETWNPSSLVDHVHGLTEVTVSRLAWPLTLVLAYAAAEVIGGLVSGSLALLADAGHIRELQGGDSGPSGGRGSIPSPRS